VYSQDQDVEAGRLGECPVCVQYDFRANGEPQVGNAYFIARHHFTEKQLEYLYGGESQPKVSTPVSIDIAKAVNHVVDPKHNIKENGMVLPIRSLKDEVKGIQNEKHLRLERKERREVIQQKETRPPS
jgi:hypothetical protein